MENRTCPMLELVDIYKSYGDVEVLKGISSSIEKGELLTFVGPSGCGKTTLLRIVGGFTPATSGRVILDGQDISALPPNMRNTKMVFQSYALFPHMNLRKNIGFGLTLKKWSKKDIRKRVDEMLELVHMEGLGERTIDQISGGQQQRVALARALALGPKVLLLDEPLSNLDANLRVVMREEIRKIQEQIGITTIFVTHDQYEAMSISDRLLVLKDGIIQQIGSPIEIYERPANEFIAGFVGYVNLLDGTVSKKGNGKDTFKISTKYGDIEIDSERKDIGDGDDIQVVVRPESLSLEKPNAAVKQNGIRGTILTQMYAGNHSKFSVQVGNKSIIVDQHNPKDAPRYQNNEPVELLIPRNAHILKRR